MLPQEVLHRLDWDFVRLIRNGRIIRMILSDLQNDENFERLMCGMDLQVNEFEAIRDFLVEAS